MAIRYDTALDLTFHALGDGTRRAMLAVLARRGECTAGELGGRFDIAQPTASKHLRVLERANLVSRHIEGREHYFRIVLKQLAEAESWISRHRHFWDGTLKRLGGFLDDLEKTGR